MNNPTSYGNFADDFVIYNASQPGMTLASGSTSGYGSIYFADGTSGNTVSRGQIQYSHSNDFMQFSTAATEKLRITSDGKIGINQSTPQTTFHSTGTTNGQQATFGIDDSGLKISTFQKTDNDAGVILDAQKSSNGTLTFATTGTERLRITSGGEVTIGTNAPPASAKLTVRAANAEISAYSSAGGSSKLSLGDTNDHDDGSIRYVNGSGYQYMLFSTAASEKVRIDSSGRVMIGNTVASSFTGNSSDNLVVGSGSGGEGITVYSATNNQGSITFADGTSGNAAYRGAAVEYSHTVDQLAFRTAGTGNRMVIDSSGRMLVGTASPKRQLHINGGNETVKIRLQIPQQAVPMMEKGSRLELQPNGDAFLEQRENSPLIFYTNNTEAMRLDSSRRLLIGTTTQVMRQYDNLTIHSSGDTGITIRASETDSSSIYFADGAGGTNVYTGAIIYDHATNHMSLHTNSGAERMRIDSAGRLLINHTADTAGGGYASILQVCDTSYQGSSISLRRDGGTGGPTLIFGKSRSSSKGGVNVVASGDNLGSVTFYGS